MKNILIFLLPLLLLFSCNQKPTYTINGVFKEGIGKKIVLSELSNLRILRIIDSVNVDANGKFTFTGDSFGEIKEARLSIVGTRFREDFIIEDTVINVNIQEKVITEKYTKYLFDLDRGKEDAIYAKLKSNYKKRRTVWGGATNRVVKANAAGEFSNENLVKTRAKLDTDFIDETLNILSNYPDSYGTYFYIKNYMLRFDSLPFVEKAFNNLSERIKNSSEATVFKSEVEEIKRSYVGGTPHDFSIPSLDGGEVSLYQYRGKVLLIDCWATWCGPCIKAMPHIGEVYKKFHPKGLEVLGISYDRDENKWRNFLKKNEYVVWDQASSLKEWSCPSAKVFAVNTIPATILIDKNGVIVARDLKGEELEAKIKEILLVE
ncbi:TlpA disulfide reductase family protein [Polaribacter sp. AHE13PA]|uniref:TlpA disulfide reductase family protein n=1 Tax=Polaribacter sp. AHE13PA TaxID=2745562 RepID=UPI001C4F396E|nr:TlpA disulfide reductase family protein [Polaribacter sp. AHE13PA]QXP66417.1 AhpC/TSA family protein [Polaribacter sp. AHE13PA]